MFSVMYTWGITKRRRSFSPIVRDLCFDAQISDHNLKKENEERRTGTSHPHLAPLFRSEVGSGVRGFKGLLGILLGSVYARTLVSPGSASYTNSVTHRRVLRYEALGTKVYHFLAKSVLWTTGLLNPFGAPKPLPTLPSSKFVKKKGFQSWRRYVTQNRRNLILALRCVNMC